jgi:SNF2 family DNA or RNA helicase
MLTLGTIEERIHQVLEEKRQLFDAVFSETDVPASLGLTQEDLFGLFNLSVPAPAKRMAA